MPLKTKEQREADAAEMKARMAPEPSELEGPRLDAQLQRHATSTLKRFNRVLSYWRRRYPDMPITSMEVTAAGIAFEARPKA